MKTTADSIFTAYGLFWKRSLWELDCHWILGWRPNYSQWRDAPSAAQFLLNDQAAIYVLHGPDREILYVGQTGSGENRLGHRLWQHAHSEKRDRWTHFSWFAFLPITPWNKNNEDSFKNKSFVAQHQDKKFSESELINSSLNQIEAVFINLLEPRLNKQDGRWTETVKLEQWSAFEHTSNDDIWEKLIQIEEKIDGKVK